MGAYTDARRSSSSRIDWLQLGLDHAPRQASQRSSDMFIERFLLTWSETSGMSCCHIIRVSIVRTTPACLNVPTMPTAIEASPCNE